MRLESRTAIVTGGASGIGLATARKLAVEGMNVVLADVDEAGLALAVEAIGADGSAVTAVVTDVSDFASMDDLARRVYAEFGSVHVVHLNAGVAGAASLFDEVTDGWQRMVGVNLMGVVWGIKAFARRMVEGGEEGIILATSSGAGTDGTTYETPAYAMTKIAVLSVMESLFGQLAAQRSRVRAAVVFPPLTATNLSGSPEVMAQVESKLRSKGVPAALVPPDQVAALVIDGIKRDRFFIRVGRAESEQFFGGAISDEYLEWNEQMIRGRAGAVLEDGDPRRYLW